MGHVRPIPVQSRTPADSLAIVQLEAFVFHGTRAENLAARQVGVGALRAIGLVQTTVQLNASPVGPMT